MKTRITISILLTAISLGLVAQSVTISPNKASAGQTFAVTISGKNTAFLTGVNTIDFVYNSAITSDVIFTNQNVLNDSVITGTVTIASGVAYPKNFQLRISNTINPPINIGGGISIINTDTIIPRLNFGHLGSINQGGYSTLIIRGINTHFGTAKNNTVKICKYGIESKSIAVSNFKVVENRITNEMSLSLDVYVDLKAKIGPYSIIVENEIDGKMTSDTVFTVMNPFPMSIINIEHKYAKRNEEKEIYIVGASNTKFKSNPPTILFVKNNVISKDVEITNMTIQSDVNAIAWLKVKPTAEMGKYNIAYFYPSDLDTMYLTNYFSILAATGTNEIAENTTKIFPNPAKNLLNIESKNNVISVHIFDLMGKEIMNKISEKTTQNLQLDLTQIEIPKGIYFIKVQSMESLVTQKIIIE